MHVKNDYNHREGDRYTALEQLRLALALESNSKPKEENHQAENLDSSLSSSCCWLLPCTAPERCKKNHCFNNKSHSQEIPSLHAAVLDAAENDRIPWTTRLERIENCLQSCIDVNVKDQRGETALTYVKQLLRRGHFLLAYQIAALLLDRGAHVDAEDLTHQTLLSHSVSCLDQSVNLTRLLLNHGADVWHGTDFGTTKENRAIHYAESPFSTFLQAVVRCRCIEGAVLTANLLGRIMGSRPEAMRLLVVRSMVRHGRCVRVLGPVFLQLKSLLSPYWRQPPKLSYSAWKAIRTAVGPHRLVRELQQLGLPPLLQRFVIMED